MANVSKITKKMHSNPRDWRIEQLETVAKHYGVSLRKSGGSHVVFDHPDWVELLCVPAHRPIKPIYVKKFLALIELLEENHENG
jgi:predicted RNA binding protein YcfA (HicA-like mRNA interferase family)